MENLTQDEIGVLIIRAAKSGYRDIVAALLAQKHNKLDGTLEKALSEALQSNSLATVMFLIENGADGGKLFRYNDDDMYWYHEYKIDEKKITLPIQKYFKAYYEEKSACCKHCDSLRRSLSPQHRNCCPHCTGC